MITVKILPNIARWYGHETDIDWMPQTAGKHEIDLQTLTNWIACMKSDLERETGSGYYAEDRQWWLINSLKRQIANLEKSLSEVGA